MDDIRPYFEPPRYPTDDESDSDTRLTLTASMESDPSELSYPSYHVETDLSEPSFLSVICLSSDSASSSAALVTHHPQFMVAGSFALVLCLVGVVELEDEDVVMLLPVVLGTVNSHQMNDVEFTCEAEHKDSPFRL